MTRPTTKLMRRQPSRNKDEQTEGKLQQEIFRRFSGNPDGCPCRVPLRRGQYPRSATAAADDNSSLPPGTGATEPTTGLHGTLARPRKRRGSAATPTFAGSLDARMPRD